MKRERNNFFSESGYTNGYMYNQYPNPVMNGMGQMEASSSFYMNQGNGELNNYQAKISRLERQVNRLESRVSKLESSQNFESSINEDSKDISNNMYIL